MIEPPDRPIANSGARPAARQVVTAVEFDMVWARLGLGPTPVALRLASPGHSHAERREIQAAGWKALRQRGLAGPAGLDPELVRLLHLLAAPAEQLELRAWWGRSVRAVAAGLPGAGVLAVRQDLTVALTACGSLPSGLLGEIAPGQAGPGRASTVRTEVLTAALAAPRSALRAELIARDVPPTDAGVLARMLDGVDRRAQVVALAADRWGVSRRSGGVVGILEGRQGRYVMTRSTAGDGVEWTTVAPTDRRRLRHRITELLAGAAAVAANCGVSAPIRG